MQRSGVFANTTDDDPIINLAAAVCRCAMMDYAGELKKCRTTDKKIRTLKAKHQELAESIRTGSISPADAVQMMQKLKDKRSKYFRTRRYIYLKLDTLQKWFSTEWAGTLSLGCAEQLRERAELPYLRCSFLVKQKGAKA